MQAHRRVRLAVIAVAALALSAPEASGKPKTGKFRAGSSLGPVRTVSATGSNAIGLGQTSSATATCPPGTQAVSGGFSAPANSTNTLGIYESRRTSPQTWTASGVALTPNGGAATAYANCRKLTNVRVTEVSSTAVVPSGAGQTATASADCDPEPWTAHGGGYRVTFGPGPTQVALPQQSMSTAPRSWTVQVVNNTAGTQTLTASVYCASGVKLPKPKTATNTASQVAAPTFAANDVSASPSCTPRKCTRCGGRKKGKGKKRSASSAKGKGRRKKKKKGAEDLAAGGFSTPPFGTAGSAVTLITENRIAGASWLVRGVNIGPPGTLTVTSQGICH